MWDSCFFWNHQIFARRNKDRLNQCHLIDSIGMLCLIQEEKEPPKSVTNLPTARGHMSRPSAAHTLLTGGNVLRSVAAGPALKQQGPAVAHWLFIGPQTHRQTSSSHQCRRILLLLLLLLETTTTPPLSGVPASRMLFYIKKKKGFLPPPAWPCALRLIWRKA